MYVQPKAKPQDGSAILSTIARCCGDRDISAQPPIDRSRRVDFALSRARKTVSAIHLNTSSHNYAAATEPLHASDCASSSGSRRAIP